jgi:hypothetical protein
MDKTLYTSWGTLVLVAIAVGGLVAIGCQRKTPPATDSTSIQKHAEELKKQNEREMKNK